MLIQVLTRPCFPRISRESEKIMLTDNYDPIDDSLQRSMTAFKFDHDLFEKNLLWMMQRKKEVLKAFLLLLVPSGLIVMIKQGKSGKKV